MPSAPGITATLVHRLSDLPSGAGALLAAAPFQSSAAWWECCIAAALPLGAQPLFVVCDRAGETLGLLPLMVQAGRLASLVTPYTCLYQPLVSRGVAPDDVHRMGLAAGRALRAWPSLRFDALDAAWDGLQPLQSGLHAAGWRGDRFDAFGNWHADVAGQGWDAYLSARPGALRETLRRKLRRHGAAVTLTVARTPAEAAAALPAYERVYAQSWKQAEPYPAFNATLLDRAAAAGVLRLGLLLHDGAPVAAQYWIVDGGTATVLKLAHVDGLSAMSPGTLLTAMMIRTLLEQDAPAVLDFGRGDDAYKQAWTDRRRQRIGVMLARPWHPRGMPVLLRQKAGAILRRLRA